MSGKDDSSGLKPGWKARFVLRRNRLIGNPRFQEWAARTPVFRTIARRKAARQFNLLAGFVYTQIAAAYVQTGLLQYLAQGLRNPGDIADFLGWDAPATERILRAGAAIDLAESPQPGLWTLGETGAALSANDGATAMTRHHALLYHDLQDPVALLAAGPGQATQLNRFWTYAGTGGDDSMPYTELMAATQPMVWQQILPRYDFGNHRRVLDIGGGSGVFLTAVGKTATGVELGLFDLPDVVPQAEGRFADAGILERVKLHPGSFKSDAIPSGYDLITLVRILHDHDDPVVEALLAKIRAALPSDGKLLIVEPMAGTSGAEAMGDAYFGMYLWAMGSGRPRSMSEYDKMLGKAGFSSVRKISTDLPLVASAIVASP